MIDAQYLERMRRYVSLRRPEVKIKEFLGEGTDGAVWATNRVTAIKVFRTEFGYSNERDAYRRLAEWGVTRQLAGFWLPEMQCSNDSLDR